MTTYFSSFKKTFHDISPIHSQFYADCYEYANRTQIQLFYRTPIKPFLALFKIGRNL